jgi:hypothetical protein
MKLWIPEDRLSHHIQLCGRTGTRKSSIIRGFVDQAIERNWPCVFLDAKREFWEEYGDPDRDALFDPLDSRGIDWQLGEEAKDEIRGMAVMEGAFPDVTGKSAFFQDYARAITAYVVGVYHPDCSTLSSWFINRDEIIRRVSGTEFYDTLTKDGEMIDGIFATINQFGQGLRLMAKAKGSRPFSVRKWGEMGKSRVGHIFLTTDPHTRKALKPINSMVMDLILLALQQHGAPAFIVGDEIPLVGRIPQLGDAMRLMRSAGCPILLGYQDFPTMADVYGERQAKSIVSNAYTQIVLGQNEPDTAEWSSRLLGLPTDIKRKQEYKNFHWWQKHQHQTKTEEVRQSAVSGGEIQSLEDGCGFLRQAGVITPLKVKWRPSTPRIHKYLERHIPVTPQNVVTITKTKTPSRYAKKSVPSGVECNPVPAP